MRLAAALCAALALVACQSKPDPDYTAFRSNQDPVTTASRIADAMGDCWFGGTRPAFATYSYAPELNSFSGRPRVLIVSKTDPHGLPKLVIEASGAERGAQVKLFGPLLGTAEAAAIQRDVSRWAAGSTAC